MLKAAELYQSVRKLVLRAHGRRMWQRAVKIAEKFGSKSVDQGSDYTTTTYELVVTVGSVWMKIVKSSNRWGGDYVLIDSTGGRVFEARECSEEPKNQLDTVRSVYLPVNAPGKLRTRQRIQIDAYIPGPWEDALDERSIATAVRKEADSRRAEAEKKLVEVEQNRPLTEAEKDAAVKFGLKSRPVC